MPLLTGQLRDFTGNGGDRGMASTNSHRVESNLAAAGHSLCTWSARSDVFEITRAATYRTMCEVQYNNLSCYTTANVLLQLLCNRLLLSNSKIYKIVLQMKSYFI